MENILKNLEPTRKILFEKINQPSPAAEYLIDVLNFLNKTELVKTEEQMVSSNTIDMGGDDLMNHLLNLPPNEFMTYMRTDHSLAESGEKIPEETFCQYYYDNQGTIIIETVNKVNSIKKSSLLGIHYELYRFLKSDRFGNLKDDELIEQIKIGASKFFDEEIKNFDVKEVYQEDLWTNAEVE